VSGRTDETASSKTRQIKNKSQRKCGAGKSGTIYATYADEIEKRVPDLPCIFFFLSGI
jgi:hypothetical protein